MANGNSLWYERVKSRLRRLQCYDLFKWWVRTHMVPQVWPKVTSRGNYPDFNIRTICCAAETVHLSMPKLPQRYSFDERFLSVQGLLSTRIPGNFNWPSKPWSILWGMHQWRSSGERSYAETYFRTLLLDGWNEVWRLRSPWWRSLLGMSWHLWQP